MTTENGQNLPSNVVVNKPSEVNLLDLLKDGRHFSEERGGHTHIVDSLTGVSVVVLENDPAKALSSALVRVESPTGVVTFVQEGLRLDVVRGETRYNPLVLAKICQRIAEGGSVTKICKEPGMPSYNTLCHWRRAHPEASRMIEEARRDRAEYLRDEALAKVEDTYRDEVGGKGAVAAASLALEAAKWAASVDNEKYNPKAKVEATVNVPTQIIVQTGINRE